jgi:hypothetical protein
LALSFFPCDFFFFKSKVPGTFFPCELFLSILLGH